MATRVRRPHRRAGVGTRLVALVLLVIVPLAALSAVNALYDRDVAADQAYARTGEIVSTGVGVLETLVEQTDLLLQTIDRTTDTRGDCSAELQAALVPDGPYRNLYAVEQDGTVDCTATREPLALDVSDAAWFRRTRDRADLSLTIPAPGLTTADPVMIVGRPRTAPFGAAGVDAGPQGPSGALAASLDLTRLVDFVDPGRLPAESVVQVLDEQGRVVARNVDIDRYLLEPAPLFPRIEGRDGGDLEGRGVDGVDRLYTFERVQLDGETVYLAAGIARGEAYAGADRRLAWSLGILAVLGVAVAAVALLAGRSLLVAPIERLRGAMAGFRSGDVSRRVGDLGGPAEVEELGRAFDEMADEIQARLEDQQRLLDQLEEASEAERRSISAGIHDETLQNLSALGIRLRLLRRWLDDPDRHADVDRILGLLDQTSAQLRGLLYDLRPPEFDRIGLLATLRETLEVRYEDVLDDWSVTGELDPAVPDWAQTLLYRVAMQALANVRQHAGASRVDIHVGPGPRGVRMDVVDDGRGFDVAVVERDERPGHIGLRVMRDRARAVGGEVMITSEPGLGTTVRVDVPVPAVADDRGTPPDQGGGRDGA